jgi:hypothetical protein
MFDTHRRAHCRTDFIVIGNGWPACDEVIDFASHRHTVLVARLAWIDGTVETPALARK